ncbi:M20/M25/M40 family metallo-hydrolase [Streptomyces sp. 372A]
MSLLDRATDRPVRRRADRPTRRSLAASLLVPVLLLLTGTAAVVPLATPDPAPATAPAGRFSAERALAALPDIAAEPHPSGSVAQERVRERLLERLRAAGTSPQVITRVASRTEAGESAVGRVSDIYATVPGSDPTGTVLLVAHYDSVPTGPGAADNGANVAAALEVLRALQSGPRPRNDIGLLLTDGEEYGLLGAQAFIDSGLAPDLRRTTAVNLEARGTSGPAVLFQALGEGLTPAVRQAGAYTTSLADEVFGLLPNDTDLTALSDGGMRGLNLAYFEGAPHYHTPHDSIDRVSAASTQDIGDAALAAVRQFAGADLSAAGGRSTYFSVAGTVLSYPEQLVLPLAGTAALGWSALLLFGRRRGLSARAALRAAAALPAALLVAALVGAAGWWVLSLLRPDLVLTAGNAHNPGRYLCAEALLLATALLGWYRWLRRRVAPLDLAMGVLAWFWLLALICSVLLPGAAYLFTWPALIGTAAAALAVRLSGPESLWRTAAAGAAAVPAMALTLPLLLLLLPALGLSLTAVPLTLAALPAALALTQLDPLLIRPAPARSRRALTAATAALALIAAGTFGAITAVDGYNADRPRAVSLGYLLDGDTGRALWVSSGGPDQPVVGPLVTDGRLVPGDGVPMFRDLGLQAGPAPRAAIELPRTDRPTTTVQNGVRVVRAKIHLPAGTHRFVLYANTSRHTVLDATLDGAPAAGSPNLPASAGDWRWTTSYAAPPTDGVDLTLRYRGDGPLPLQILAFQAGLPATPTTPSLPADLTWTAWPSVAGQSLIVRTLAL